MTHIITPQNMARESILEPGFWFYLPAADLYTPEFVEQVYHTLCAWIHEATGHVTIHRNEHTNQVFVEPLAAHAWNDILMYLKLRGMDVTWLRSIYQLPEQQ